MAAVSENIANLILAQATAKGTDTWTRIQSASQVYVRGYAQTLLATAKAVTAGDITASEAKQYAKNAMFLLAMGITNVTHIMLFEVQSFLNGVIKAIKDQINGLLPFALL